MVGNWGKVYNRSMTFVTEYLYRDCPWCATKNIAFEKHGNTFGVTTSKGMNRQWTAASCPRCGGAILLESRADNLPGLLRAVPDKLEENEIKHLPEDVESYWQNAITALNAGIPSSAAVELRRALEAASKHQGVDERTLVKSVEKLVELGLVTKSFESVLSHVRKIGNQGAHASDEQLSELEVSSAMEFTKQILRNLFEVPEELSLIQGSEDTEHSAS